MVRTKADAGLKATGAKAPRKALATATPTRSASSDGDSKNKAHGGGNTYHPRETPEWQKPITTFFIRPPSSSEVSDGSGSSKEQVEQCSSGSSSSEADK